MRFFRLYDILKMESYGEDFMERYVRREKIRIIVHNKKEEKRHFHQDIELLYVMHGNVKVSIDEQITTLQAEDIFIINPNKQHHLQMSCDVLYAQFLIAYELIGDVLKSTEFMFWCDSTNNQSDEIEKLRMVIRKLLNHYLHGHERIADFYHISLCYQLMDILSMHFLVRSIDRENDEEKDKFEERLTLINNYIWANYSQSISLQELSDMLYLSNAYLSRFFKKNYGMSFAKYISKIRLYHAVDELLFSNIPITRIAYDNGFSSLTVFNKAFKETYGETPSTMRKKTKKLEQDKNNSNVQEEVNKRLEQYLSINKIEEDKETIAKELKATHSIKNTELVHPMWNQLINIGSAEDILRSEVQEHILLLKNSLGFKYIRK